jgi:hypothetical protein
MKAASNMVQGMHHLLREQLLPLPLCPLLLLIPL